MEAYTGQILAVAFKVIPTGWLACDGAPQSISQYNALFSLLGLTYGGDGVTTFAVPDLRGRLVVCQGQGRHGGSDYDLGEIGGVEGVSLTLSQIEPHRHALMATTDLGGPNPGPPPVYGPESYFVLARNTQTQVSMYHPGPPDGALAAASLDVYKGSSQPHENRQPFLAINYIICAEGIYPSRS